VVCFGWLALPPELVGTVSTYCEIPGVGGRTRGLSRLTGDETPEIRYRRVVPMWFGMESNKELR